MERIIKTVSHKTGMPPGSLVHIGDLPAGDVTVRAIRYTDSELEEFPVLDKDALMQLKEKDGVIWIQVDGVHQPEKIAAIGEVFCLHSLTLEDILNTGQRSKMEEFDDYLFLIGKILSFEEATDMVREKHFCLVLMQHLVLSFHEAGANIFGAVESRIRKGAGKIRKKNADYLAYTLFDSMVDNYFLILETIGGQIEEVEDELLATPSRDSLERLHLLKRELTILRKSVWPVREVTNSLVRSDVYFVQEDSLKYFMDIYDHTLQIIETIEAFRDVTSSLYDMYLSSVSHRMNQVMKVLTVIATIFIPLTFIVGIYGMNFHYMPELTWRWGYFATLAIMAILGIGMALYFKKKDWF
jgi:magnesium transporter